MADQAEVTRWAKLVAAGYASDCMPLLSSFDVLDLAGELDEPMSHCIMLAIPPTDRGPHYVNPVLDRWEAKTRRRRGLRLEVADYGLGRVTMS